MSWKGHRKTEGCQSKADYVALKSLQKASEKRRFAMRVRLAKRDLEYAASPCAAQVTVEERDLRNSELGRIVRIETRGRTVVGFASASGSMAY